MGIEKSENPYKKKWDIFLKTLAEVGFTLNIMKILANKVPFFSTISKSVTNIEGGFCFIPPSSNISFPDVETSVPLWRGTDIPSFGITLHTHLAKTGQKIQQYLSPK